MSELINYRKPDLQSLAVEFEVDLLPNDTIMKIIAKIEASPVYDKEAAIAQIKFIAEDRAQRLAEEKLDLERERQREEKEAERRHELELEKARAAAETVSLASTREDRPPKIALKSLMQRYDPEKSDISLFLALFQRQAKKANIESDQMVSQLLTLLPVDIAELIIREPEHLMDDFDYIKGKLLDRFQLSAETHRVRFVQHARRPGALWKDLVFELRTYLTGWIEGLNVKTFEELKDLMIADQLKRRAPHDMKEHLIDSWSKWADPELVASKFDEYEAVRKPPRKPVPPKFPDKKTVEKPKVFDKNRFEKKPSDNKPPNWRDKNDTAQREKLFEKRKPPACYICGSLQHLRPSCPELKKHSTEMANNLGIQAEFGPSFEPYLSTARVNNIETTILRDSGTSIDLASGRVIRPEQLNGEIIWIKQPLENEFRCLPLATVELEIDKVGVIRTKAAVVGSEIEMNHYLLGNQTQELIDNQKQNPHRINAVVTRQQTRRKIETVTVSDSSEDINDKSEPLPRSESPSGERERASSSEREEGGNDLSSLPPVERDSILELTDISSENFREEQQKDETLENLWEKARDVRNVHFLVDKELLFRKVLDHRGEERKQLVIPLKFRDQILRLCHEGIASHLGATKTKDKLLRYYFWPNAINDAEAFVKACDPCQRVGKAGEKKKAPLKLVPIIKEPFSRLNCDLVGPLPLSEKNNRYMLTAMCMASKYPEAIPLADIKSESVIEALLLVFSRVGFPRELQCDLGTCFTSNLTTTFFEKFGIKVVHSSVHRPSTNPIERWHRSVKRLLKVLCLENGTSWEKNLPYALLALRTVTHESTGFSPAELVHGRNLRTPETLLFERWTEPAEEENAVTDYVFNLVNRLKRCQELAAERMTEMRDKRKIWYDRDAIQRKFKPGDQVLVLATYKPNKLSVNWIGPGVIESQLSDTNYIVKMPGKRERAQIYHVNLLKPYHRRAEIVNVLMCENFDRRMQEADLDIPYPVADPDIYDFNEIMKDNELTDRCTPEQIEQLKTLLTNHKLVFSNDPGRTDLIEHDIELISNQPVRLKPYRTSPRQTEILKTELKRMLDLKIIEVGESDYTSPMILVEAPGRDPRPCIDYRKLNSITRAEFFPLPNIEERVERVAAAKFITVIDLTKGYWQIPLTPRARKLAAFVTSFGCFLPLVMPFGLVSAPYRFSKFMSLLLQGFEEFCVPYLDDIAIFSDSWEDHLKHIDCVLKRITEAKLKIKPSKCKFAQSSVKYLGHMVGGGCRTPAEAKIQTVLEFPAPKSKTQIRQFLGMTGYYARYINNYATIVEPLTRALKGKNRKEAIEWTSEMNQALNELKTKLTEKPVLYAPDYNREFVVQTDASDKGIGVIMAQRKNNEEHPVLYLSRKFTDPEKNYSTTEKECAGIIFAIKKLRHYLDGQKFVIETDHNPLVWLKTNAGNNPRLMRWALALQPFNYSVVHRPGRDIAHADCLSRIE